MTNLFKTHSKSLILWKDAFFTDTVFNRKLWWIGKNHELGWSLHCIHSCINSAFSYLSNIAKNLVCVEMCRYSENLFLVSV